MSESFDLETFLPYRLNRISEAVSVAFASQYKALYGMTRPEWRTLAALGQLGDLTATQIRQHSAMHKTQVSRAVRRLEVRRWLTRQTDVDDRRVEHLTLTGNGQAAYARLAALAQSYQADLERLLGAPGTSALKTGLSALEARIIRPHSDD